MSKRKVTEYLRAGMSPFAKWFNGLDSFAAAKITTALYRLEQVIFQMLGQLGKVFWSTRLTLDQVIGFISARKAMR